MYIFNASLLCDDCGESNGRRRARRPTAGRPVATGRAKDLLTRERPMGEAVKRTWTALLDAYGDTLADVTLRDLWEERLK